MKEYSLHPDRWIDGNGYRKQPVAGSDDLDSAGALAQVVEIPPGETVPDHAHKTSYEFYYIIAGTCLLWVNDVERRLAPGDMVLTEPGDVHRLHNDGEEPFRLLVFKTNATEGDTYWGEATDK